ncbi:MAG: DsbE family thiol:disulfide interchange protein [Porticoccaceae bacterium]|nr:DsbE family thiol:disulfide interchange protein [Porticoccaceae bacterium]
MTETSDTSGAQNSADPAPKPRRNLTWVVLPVAVFAVLVALFGFALTTGDPSRLPSALIGKPVPATEFPALEGLVMHGGPVPGFTSKSLAQGDVSVVNFWASWCAECATEQDLLGQLQQRTGVPLYGVNYKDKPVAARRFLGRYGNPFTAVGTDANGRNAIEWGVYGMPETFVVNGKGEIVYKHIGAVTPASITDKLIPAIEKAKSDATAVN